MNHVPDSWLRWIRRALIGYSLLYLVGYGFVAAVLHKGLQGGYGYTLVLGVILATHLVYELNASIWIFKRNAWMATCVSLAFALAQTLVVGEATGVYHSPYFLAIFGLVFIAPAIGAYIDAGINLLFIMGFVLGVAGFFRTPTDVPYGIGFLSINILASILGYVIWRRYYISQHSSVDILSSSLQNEKVKSDIILGAIEDGVILIDAQKTIQLFNPGAAKITGWPSKEAVGLDYHSVLKLVDDKSNAYSDEQNPFSVVFRRKATVRDHQAILVSRSDKHIALHISVSPLIDSRGNMLGAVAVFRDISEERGEERQRAEFISTASHEMRTPVAAIEGYLALALNSKVSTIDSKAREYLEKAHASTKHLGELFQDLLTSAKAEDGRLTNHPEVIEMGQFLEQFTQDLRFTADKKHLGLQFVIGKGGEPDKPSDSKMIRPFYYVYADPDRIREVVTNFFDNAVKYTQQGKISIGLTGNDSVVQFYVRDTGAGIPAEDIPHLFQKFYRVDSSATRTIGGTGLGLFICRKIIELYEGQMWVESKWGEGSTFFVNLPRLSTQRVAQLQAAQASTQTKATPTQGS